MLSGIFLRNNLRLRFGSRRGMFSAVDDALSSSDQRRRPQLPKQLMGARSLAPLQHVLDELHAAPVHGNCRVADDHLLVLHLLAFFNPVVRSLRLMEDLSQTPTAVTLIGGLEPVP